jgi:hypothetical protein
MIKHNSEAPVPFNGLRFTGVLNIRDANTATEKYSRLHRGPINLFILEYITRAKESRLLSSILERHLSLIKEINSTWEHTCMHYVR